MNFFRSSILSVLLLLIAGCRPSGKGELQSWFIPNGKLKVLCTTSMIQDLVLQVGKDDIDCLTLIQGESDPHSYQLVKGDDEKFLRADVIFYNGLGLEHGASLSSALKNNPKALSLGDILAKKRPQDIIMYNGSVDPHIWMDVSLWQKTVGPITERLIQALPERAESLRKNESALTAKLDALDRAIRNQFLAIPADERYLVSAHEAFNYFVRRYLATEQELKAGEQKEGSWQKRAMAPEGLAPDSQLSTADIQRLVDHIVQYKVKTLFAESNVSRDSLKKLTDACKRMGHAVHIAKKPLYVDAMGPKGSLASTYCGMLDYDAEQIAKGLLR